MTALSKATFVAGEPCPAFASVLVRGTRWRIECVRPCGHSGAHVTSSGRWIVGWNR